MNGYLLLEPDKIRTQVKENQYFNLICQVNIMCEFIKW